MIAALTNHLWQSTVVVLLVGLLSLALRRNRASVRHAVWMTASVKFVVPFSLLIAFGGAVSWRVAEQPVVPVTPAVVAAVGQLAEPFADDVLPMAPEAPRASSNWAQIGLAVIWAAGFLAVVAMRVRGWRRIRAAIRASTPVTMPAAGVDLDVDIRSTPALLEPGVVGIWRPILLVPAGLESALTADQLRAILVHERHHIDRRDNLTSAMHMAIEAAFWFHPLVWWIGTRLIDERERACDEHVLASGAAPDAYAEGILNVCRRYVESPVACVAGVTGSDLKKRVGAILARRVGAKLTGARRFVLTTIALAALGVPVLAGAITSPGNRRADVGQATGAALTRKFDVASIRPCTQGSSLPGGRSGGSGPMFSPGRVYLDCLSVRNLIDSAYIVQRLTAATDPNDPFGNWPGVLGVSAEEGSQRIRGGPSWVYSDNYTIEATASGLDPSKPEDRIVVIGSMLRTLLEDRFRLTVHEETEQAPMYEMTVAKSGLKIKPIKDGDCTNDRVNGPVFPEDAARLHVSPTCGAVHAGRDGPNWRYQHSGQSLRSIATMLSSDLGMKVLDQTGISDKFTFTWVYGPDERTPGSLHRLEAMDSGNRESPTAPDVFTALKEQVGLQLAPTKGSRAYLVVDHIERPASAAAVAAATVGRPESAASASSRQASSPLPQKFEVASIRPCENTPNVPGGRNGGVGPVFSPGTFVYNCGTLEQLINGAYIMNGDPLLNDNGRGAAGQQRDEKAFPARIRGGPDWVRTDRFMIEAKTAVSSGNVGREAVPERRTMMGPMLRALLEERFKLTLHREVQADVPMYALRVAKSGLTIKPAGPDSCTPSDPNRVTPYRMDEEIEMVRKGGKPICGHGIMGGPVGPNHAIVLNGQKMDGVARWLSNVMDRYVLDQTGVSDTFVIYMEYAPDDLVPYDFKTESPTDPPTAPSITQVLKSLGLELQPTKGQKGYIVIDHVERPTFAPATAGASVGKPALAEAVVPARARGAGGSR